jgi:shikimate dehydrogenase
MINSNTKLNLLFGSNIEKSVTPELHNSLYSMLGMSDEFTFLAAEIKSDELQYAVQSIKVLGVNGVSVMQPHKTDIMQYLDDVDEAAVYIGAVNTVVNKNGILKGFNTEWLGALMPVAEMMNVEIKKITHIPKFLEDKKVGVIGAGGAARAIAFAILKAGGDLLIFNRTVSRAEIMADEFKGIFPEAKIHFFDSKHGEKLLFCDIIINSTPVSFYNSGDSLVSKKFLRTDQTVFEAIYPTPYHTKIIKEAEDTGCTTIFGEEMFLHQTVYQFELLTGIKPDEVAVRAVLQKKSNQIF